MNKYTSEKLMKELKGKLRFGMVVRLLQTYGRLSKGDSLAIKRTYTEHLGNKRVRRVEPMNGYLYDEEVELKSVEIIEDAPKITCPHCKHKFHFDIYKFEKIVDDIVYKHSPYK